MDIEMKKNVFYENWEAFKNWQIKSLNQKSSMWTSLIKDFQISNIEDYEQNLLFKLNVQNGYAFFLKAEEKWIFRITQLILKFYHFIAKSANFIKVKAFNKILLGLGNDHLAYHPLGIRYLTKNTNVDEYFKFCEAKKLSIHGPGIKAFYISTLVENFTKHLIEHRVVEIGAGLGNLASLLVYKFPISTYLIIDLPEMLLNSSVILKSLYPDIPIYFIYPGSENKIVIGEKAFFLCVPESVGDIPKNSFDLGINIDSFQEMTKTQVEFYIDCLQLVLKDKANFININRRKTLEAEKFDNNPLLYPYFPQNRVLKWETDRFMNQVYNYVNNRVDSWILRVEEINKKESGSS